MAEFSGSERTVADYLVGEVLASQPEELRRLLMRTSVLTRVNGPLADLLTGRTDGTRMLHALEEANAFVVAVDVARTWFRYHHLLADLMRLELRREAPGKIPELHRLAGRWHAEHGDLVEAIRHAQQGGDGALAGGFLIAGAIAVGAAVVTKLWLPARHRAEAPVVTPRLAMEAS